MNKQKIIVNPKRMKLTSSRRSNALVQFFPAPCKALKPVPYQLDQVMSFNLSGQVKFGILPEQTLYALFHDGRAVAPLLEQYLTLLIPGLVYVNQAGYDFVWENEKFECKTFTRNGLNFAPSYMTGKGRKVDMEIFHAHAKTLVYILCDVTRFPKINVVFKQGNQLIKDYPKGVVTFTKRWQLFGE